MTPIITSDAETGGGESAKSFIGRTRMTKCYNQLSQSAVYREDEVSVNLTVCGGSYGGGSEVLVLTYQETAGALTCGAHPGGFNGQDAYNDMLITEGSSGTRTDMPGKRTGERRNHEGGVPYAERKP